MPGKEAALNPGDRQRSIPLAQFAPLARIPGAQLVSLQWGTGGDQLRSFAPQYPILDLSQRLGNETESFANLAAAIANLDMVISCDTAIAHLAGTLGAATYVLLPKFADWRWLLDREDSPWYPTMRLFRQTRYRQWEDVFERMADELKNWIEKP